MFDLFCIHCIKSTFFPQTNRWLIDRSSMVTQIHFNSCFAIELNQFAKNLGTLCLSEKIYSHNSNNSVLQVTMN